MGSLSDQTENGVRAIRFADDGCIPNSKLPLLIYADAIFAAEVTADAIETLFSGNHWPPAWRASVFTYHHYHSTAHEVLGVASGSARLMMGGPDGEEIKVSAGQVLAIPAGVGHKRLLSSSDFMVVGGYPPGASWDLLKGDAGERPQADENIAAVPLPDSDPVQGRDGALLTLWR